MAFSVSFGDAYLMATLAVNLGRAFTKGRKSAPAEFRQVENQLYSLSAALSALDSASKTVGSALTIDPSRLPSIIQRQQADGEDIVKAMLQNCNETLNHLQATVNKYSSIVKPKDPNATAFKRWGKDIKDNWKKIAWTTEGGDLSMLRSHLTVHTNSLNLVLGVINHTQNDRLEERVTQVSTMLKEIHTWFVENLRDKTTSPPSRTQSYDVTPISDLSDVNIITNIHFELYLDLSTGPVLLCPHASLHPKWNGKRTSPESANASAQREVFHCQCPTPPGLPAPHVDTLDFLRLSPLSFAMRVASKERTWMLYKAADRSSNKLVSLLIKNVPAARIVEFEDSFVENLGSSKARSMLRRNMSTMLAYTVPAENGSPPKARVLDLMGNLQKVQNQVESVTFTVNRQSYSRNSIETIQLLHYKTLDKGELLGESALYPGDLTPINSAEVVVFYGRERGSVPPDSDICQTILTLVYKTKVIYQSGECSVLLKDVDCAGYDQNDKEAAMKNVNVSFQLTTPDMAQEFKDRLEDMRMELFVMSLRSPRSDEKLILKLQARGVHTEDIDMADSEISIVQASETERLRLIITSRDGCIVLSQELAKDFLQGPNGRPNFGSATFVVQLVGRGTRKVQKYPQGFKFFDFSDAQMDRLFGLGLAAASGNASALPGLLSRRLTELRV